MVGITFSAKLFKTYPTKNTYRFIGDCRTFVGLCRSIPCYISDFEFYNSKCTVYTALQKLSNTIELMDIDEYMAKFVGALVLILI